MPHNLTVLVGMYDHDSPWIRERKVLAEALATYGYSVETINECWPRDSYVFHQGQYVSRKEWGHFGEGGLYRQGLDYLLVSDALLRKERISEKDAREIMKTIFPRSRVHFIPEASHPYHEDVTQHGHIDLSNLLLPLDKLLVVDKSFYSGISGYRKIFEKIAEEEGLDLQFYDPESCGILQADYPLNCLPLPDGKGAERVFANKETPHFVRMLRDRGIEVIAVPFTSSTKKGGAINCATNIKEKGKNINLN